MRDEDSHKEHCVSHSTSDTASRDYGINRDSVLNSLGYSHDCVLVHNTYMYIVECTCECACTHTSCRYFHVCSGALIPNIMHDVLEGAMQYEIKLMLAFMIRNEEFFTLNQFNSRLESVELGYMEIKDQATIITNQTLNSTSNSLKQSGN